MQELRQPALSWPLISQNLAFVWTISGTVTFPKTIPKSDIELLMNTCDPQAPF